MEKHSIDALLLTQKENVIYFSGIRTITWGSKDRPIGVVVPRAKDKPVILVIPENTIEVAHHSSWIDEVYPWGGWRIKGIPRDPITAFQNACKSLCGDKGVIGLELGFDMRLGMSQVDLKDLQSKLTRFTLVDASSLLWDLRMIKTPLEIEALRKVCDATTKGFERGFSAMRPGMMERTLAGIIMSELALQTDELPGFVMIRSGKIKYGMVNVEPFEKPMEPGDIVVVDLGASYQYYCSDFMRMACIGKPSSEQRRIFDGELAAQQAGVDIIKPGIQVHEIFDACYNTLIDHGLKEHVPALERVGHGVGLEFHEMPSIAKGSDLIVQPNMVLTVEPIFWDMPDHIHGNFGLEDMVLVTENGHEVLSVFPKELHIVE
jgi:Xaa-Pro aminopeptidase